MAIRQKVSTESTGGGDDTLSKISLNGAQVTSMLEVVERVGAGELPMEAAINILTTAFPIDGRHARKLMGGIVFGANKPAETSEAQP
jgi:hypothetical protein